MAGLGPGIHVLFISNPYDVRMGGWVYIMTNRRNGTLYIGMQKNGSVGKELQVVLVELLDIFIRAGWSSARQLTYRLEDIFR